MLFWPMCLKKETQHVQWKHEEQESWPVCDTEEEVYGGDAGLLGTKPDIHYLKAGPSESL